MKLTKNQREQIRLKYDGMCAYCGCELDATWHADHLEPIRRTWDYVRDENGRIVYPSKRIDTGCLNPELDCMDNLVPACPSCNINKHSMSVEEFRNLILGFIKSLNRDSVQYRMAKKYGLVSEDVPVVVFYFEFAKANKNP